MKKENKLVKIISKTTFQTQLFLIVLLSFIFFVIIEFFLIQYTFRVRYVKNELTSVTEKINELSTQINNNEKDLIVLLSEFYEKNNAIPLYITSQTGSYTLVESNNNEYTILISSGGKTYKVSIVSFEIIFEVGDTISIYMDSSSSSDGYIAKKIVSAKGDYENGSYSESSIYLENATIIEIKTPNNINYLFESNKNVIEGLEILNSEITSFEKIKSNSAYYAGYYMNEDSNNMFILYKPTSLEGTNYFIYVVYSLVKTDFLISVVSSYYGYILLGSILIAILIALFIANAFSKPVKQIEKEMKKLAKGNYTPSENNFKNVELVSLENTLNEVKSDTENKVKNIESQNRILENLNNKLVREEELKKSFIARLSHELKTPLMVISATTEALMNGLIEDNEKDKEFETILDEVDKTTTIIKDIINIYKSTATEMNLNITRFSLNELSDSVLETLNQIAQVNHQTVNKNYESTVFIDADKVLMEQVISNYITNAFKYTVENGTIDINIKDSKESVTYEVINYGSHIKDENKEKIWLPFFRENEDIDKTSTGMGLFIVKSILESHNYSYGVENINEGVRSYFIIKK